MTKAAQKPDSHWMQIALRLARRTEGRTRPNPPVGCVVVRGGSQVGAGYHHGAGSPHAEIVALAEASEKARGATLYVTLEPCCTHGRTPPCVRKIVEAGVARVVAAVRDPNPKHNGKGLRLLRLAGIDVVEGVCRDEAAGLVAAFGKRIRTGLPYVTLKMAMTLDGRIADESRKSRWISSPESRKMVKDMRRKADAIMIGVGTAIADNPSLSAGHGGEDRTWRVIVDGRGQLPLSSSVLNDERAYSTIVAISRNCESRIRSALAAKGASVWVLRSNKAGISMKELIGRLGREGILHVLCEGGGAVARSLIEANLVDEYVFFVAPKILGGGLSVPVVAGPGWKLDRGPRLKFAGCAASGPDICIRAVPAERR